MSNDTAEANDTSQGDLWPRTAQALDRGDFTALLELLSEANVSIVDLLSVHDPDYEHAPEAFAWACFVGRTDDAETLLDHGVDPAAGFKTGMAGFHWAANRGNTDTVTMLIRREAPLEQLNMYGGTVLNCTLWSAAFEHCDAHAEIVESLIGAGAEIESGSLEWWERQEVPSNETKRRISDALRSAK